MSTIRELRVARDWPQSLLAQHSGISIPIISHMENGIAVSPTSFKLVCQALEIEPEKVEGVKLAKRVRARPPRHNP